MKQQQQASGARPQADAVSGQGPGREAGAQPESAPQGEVAIRAFSGEPDSPVLHIGHSTHEQRSSGKVHSWKADYTIGEDCLMWIAEVEVDGTSRTFAGSVPLTSSGPAAIAEPAVRDAVIRAIDGLDDA